jgi:hypothetical protein
MKKQTMDEQKELWRKLCHGLAMEQDPARRAQASVRLQKIVARERTRTGHSLEDAVLLDLAESLFDFLGKLAGRTANQRSPRGEITQPAARRT